MYQVTESVNILEKWIWLTLWYDDNRKSLLQTG